ncbi:SLATT domain-containing protein [Candidatus Poribacteria bacterium]|nr:SLATT domain-containing protein [Candidatus Poribacteria bacterium]
MENLTKDNIIKEAKRIEEDSLCSAKAHFYAGQFWTNLHFWIGIPAAIFAAVAGTAALARFDSRNIIAGILSIIAAILTVIMTFINPREKATIHQKAGNDYNSLKNKSRIFGQIEVEEINTIGSVEIAAQEDTKTVVNKTLLEELNELSNERDELNKESPQIPKWAYKKAIKGIEAGEATYDADKHC